MASLGLSIVYLGLAQPYKFSGGNEAYMSNSEYLNADWTLEIKRIA